MNAKLYAVVEPCESYFIRLKMKIRESLNITQQKSDLNTTATYET